MAFVVWLVAAGMLAPQLAEGTVRPPHRQPEARILVIYDSPGEGAAGARLAVPALIQLLGHFPCELEVTETAAYQAGQAHGYDGVIYLGLRPKAPLPPSLLADLQHLNRPICWLGANGEQFVSAARARELGFRVGGPTAEAYPRVLYRGQVLARPASPLPEVEVTRPDRCEVLAQAEGGNSPVPYAVRTGRFWFFAEPPANISSPQGAYLVLADQLHSFFASTPQHVRHGSSRVALLCVGGVNAHTPAEELRRLLVLLRGLRLPFAVAVTPVYLDPAHGVEARLSDERGLVGILREAQTAGASIICLGYTHQVFGRTGEEAEWWDLARDRPLPNRPAAETERRLRAAVRELVRCGLPPVAWATPMGRATGADYAKIAQVFSSACEARLPGEGAREPQVLPYVLIADSYGQRLLPANLPPLGREGRIEPLLEMVHSLSLVPDPWVTLMVSPDAPPEAVRLLVAELRGMGYQFADLRRLSATVRTPEVGIFTVSEPQQVWNLLPSGWEAIALLPGRRGLVEVEREGGKGRGEPVVKPGMVLVGYPRGQRPRVVFAFEGGPEGASSRLLAGIAAVILGLGLVLVAALGLAYMMQVVTRRVAR